MMQPESLFQDLLRFDPNDNLSIYRKVLNERQRQYLHDLDSGKYTPWIFPWDFLPAVFLFLGIWLAPRFGRLSHFSRYAFYVSTVVHCIVKSTNVRTLGLACGYGIGLAGQLGMIVGFCLLILHDPKTDFKRLEIRNVGETPAREQELATSTGQLKNGSVDLRQRKVYGINSEGHQPSEQNDGIAATLPYRLVWQDYPSGLRHCLDWTMDLTTSFRGLNWNYRNRNVPGPDIPVPMKDKTEEQSKSSVNSVSRSTAIPTNTLKELCNQAWKDFFFYYACLDILKTTLVTDGYFLGIQSIHSPTPWHWLAILDDLIPGTTKFVRLVLSLSAVVTALSFIFSLGPLFFAVILPQIFRDRLTQLTATPLLEPCMYTPQFGPMFKTLCTDGLAGMWGMWWHQLFRYSVSEPSRILLKRLKIDRKSQTGRTIQLFIAFFLSGSIHMAAAYTTYSLVRSKPLMPMLFFLSQAIGILVQTGLAKSARKVFPNTPKILNKAASFSFVVVWLWFTGPLLASDFARCGIWLFEPIPVSLLRGMGFGSGDCWIPWINIPPGGKIIGWWSGDTWYRTGIAIF